MKHVGAVSRGRPRAAQVSDVDLISVILNLLAAFSPILAYKLQQPKAA